MKYCESCKVTIQNDRKRCPLCEDELTERDGACEQDYPTAYASSLSERNTRFLIYGLVTLVTICISIDLLMSKTAHWSIIVAVGLLYVWLSVRFVKKSRRNIGLLAIIQVFGISLLSFAVDFTTGYYRWSTDYVIPFVIISAAGLLSVVLIMRPKRFRDYILYQLGISVLGVVFSVVSLLDQSSAAWTGVVGVLYSGFTLLGIILFTSRKTKHELKKRFHI